jgi:hypothetical protein
MAYTGLTSVNSENSYTTIIYVQGICLPHFNIKDGIENITIEDTGQKEIAGSMIIPNTIGNNLNPQQRPAVFTVG